MSMLNLSHQAAVEALCSGTYLENYLNTIEFLPDDLQRNLSQMRELDIKSRELLHDIETNLNLLLDGSLVEGSSAWKKCYYGIQRALVLCQDSGDEKLSLLSTMHEHIENRSRQLDHNLENLEPTAKKEPEKEEPPPPPRKEKEPKHRDSVSEPVEKPAGVKRHRRSKATEEAKAEEVPPKVSRLKPVQDPEPKDKAGSTTAAAATAAGGQKKKKKRKVVKKEREMSPPELAIDPNEPTYCLCDQVSYGEMIGCDNTECKIEWYHFNCVQLTHKPKGKWFCPNCRGDRPNVMKKTL